MLLSLLALATSALVVTTPTCDPILKGDREFFQELITAGFSEQEGTVEKFVSGEISTLTLSAKDDEINIGLVFLRDTKNLIACNIGMWINVGVKQYGNLGASDSSGFSTSEEAFYASLDIFQAIVSASSQITKLIK